MKKISIERIENGYILKVKDWGDSSMQERYSATKYVFTDFKSVVDWMRQEFEVKEEVEKYG